MGFPTSGVWAPIGVLTTAGGKVAKIDDRRIDDNRCKVVQHADEPTNRIRVAAGWFRRPDGTAGYFDTSAMPDQDGITLVDMTNETSPAAYDPPALGVQPIYYGLYYNTGLNPAWVSDGWKFDVFPDATWTSHSSHYPGFDHVVVPLAIVTYDCQWQGGSDHGGSGGPVPVVNIQDARIAFGS